MNERLKAWCERRMLAPVEPNNSGWYTHNGEDGVWVYVLNDGTWGYSHGTYQQARTEPTPERLEAFCSSIGIHLRGGEGERSDALVQIACHALSAADGIDPTTALALADEIQARFRYPDITTEWLNEIGWTVREDGIFWKHQCLSLEGIWVSRIGPWRWGSQRTESSEACWGGPLVHRGDLIRLMDLFGPDWKNPPKVDTRTTRELNEELDRIGAEFMAEESMAILEESAMARARLDENGP